MDDNNQTSGQPKPEPEECVKEQKITDHFKIMIDKARKAQKLVLINGHRPHTKNWAIIKIVKIRLFCLRKKPSKK